MLNWTLDQNGNVVLNPLMGFDAAIAMGMSCLVRLRFAANEDELRSGSQSLPLVLTPAQATELAQALQQMAAATTKDRPLERAN